MLIALKVIKLKYHITNSNKFKKQHSVYIKEILVLILGNLSSFPDRLHP